MSEEQTLTLDKTEQEATLNGGVTDDIGSETTEETLTLEDLKKKYKEAEARAKKAESTIIRHKKQNKRASEIAEENNRIRQKLEVLEKDYDKLNMELDQAQEEGYSEELVQRLKKQIQDNESEQQEAKFKKDANNALERLESKYGDDWGENISDTKESLKEIFKDNNLPENTLDIFVNNPSSFIEGRSPIVQDMMYELGQQAKKIASLEAQLAEKEKTLKNPNLNNQKRMSIMSPQSENTRKKSRLFENSKYDSLISR